MQCWIEKTISRVDYENGKGLIHRVTVTDVEGLSKTVVSERAHPVCWTSVHRRPGRIALKYYLIPTRPDEEPHTLTILTNGSTITIYLLAMRHNGVTMARMKDVHKDSGSLLMGRTTLRIPRDVVEAIDAECSRRAGSVSRNTWIIEAVMEKLTRHSSVTRPQSDGIGNG